MNLRKMAENLQREFVREADRHPHFEVAIESALRKVAERCAEITEDWKSNKNYTKLLRAGEKDGTLSFDADSYFLAAAIHKEFSLPERKDGEEK